MILRIISELFRTKKEKTTNIFRSKSFVTAMSSFLQNMDPIYTILVILRFVLVFIPQFGYIHPDEFFQTTEVVAGDVFDVEVNKPWEFTSFPIRSVSLIYILYGLPLQLLKMIGQVYPLMISGYWILVIPRLISAFLSLVIDYALYKMCKCFCLNAKFGLQIMASSYVMLTYMTKTFTNSIESVLLSSLLVLVFTNKTVELYLKTNFGEDENESIENLERSSIKNYRFKKEKKLSYNAMYKESLNKTYYCKATLIGIIGVAGLFNRPTFALMALCPAILYCNAKQEKITQHAVFVGAGAMCSFTILTLVDTYYFSENFQDLLSRCDMDKSSVSMCFLTSFLRWIVITPYNFFIYNSNPYHLAEHGLHPRYLHLTVNIHLLFGPLSFYFYKRLYHLILIAMKKKKFDKSYCPLIMIIFPLVLLSLFPHQEPRFLIPILPLVVMTGIEQIEEKSKMKNVFIFVWILFNMLLTPIYGVLHQGGVVQSLLHIEKQLNYKQSEINPIFNSDDKFVFFRTYMPPHSLLLSTRSKSQIIDVQGGNIDYFLKYLPQKLSEDNDFQQNKTLSNIYVITPSNVVTEFKEKGVNFTTMFVYYGHLSMEDTPHMAAIYNSSKNISNIMEKVQYFFVEFSNVLTLYMIKIPQDQLIHVA